MILIPNFNPEKAEDYIRSYKNLFSNLLLARDIQLLDVTSQEFLDLQNEVLQETELDSLLKNQKASGSLLDGVEDNGLIPMYKSTLWILIYLGYLGINGAEVSQITKAVDFVFDKNFDQDERLFLSKHRVYSGFLQCMNAMALRALLKLNFFTERVKKACFAHLNKIHNEEGLCRFKKGGFPCAWGLIKDLILLNEFPSSWRDNKYLETKKIIQDYLLGHNLVDGDFPRVRKPINRNWYLLAYFRSYQSDIFEAAESLVDSGITDHPMLTTTIKKIGSKCIQHSTWKCETYQSKWPLKLETRSPSPWLSLRGLRITRKLQDNP